MNINRNNIQVSFILVVLILLFSFSAGAELPKVGELKPILEVEGVTSGNFGAGKVVGPESFDVVGDDIYVLSSEDDELLHYSEGELVETFDLSEEMHYPEIVRVKNDRIYIFEGGTDLHVLYILNKAGKVIESKKLEKSVRIRDIKFDDYDRPILLNRDATIVRFDEKKEEQRELYFEDDYGDKYKYDKGKIVSPDREFEIDIDPLGEGLIYTQLSYIDKRDNFYVYADEKNMVNIRKYNLRCDLVGIAKFPDKDKIIHFPERGRDVIFKGENEIYAMANYEDKTVIYEVVLGQRLPEIEESQKKEIKNE